MNARPKQANIRNLLIVMLLAVFLRAWAVSLLPQDYDEPVYLQTAFDYADAIKAGNIQAVIDYPGVREHPALVKLVYAFDIVALGKNATWTNAFYLSRSVSAFFGTLAVMVVAILADPLSGGLLAVHTLAVKYDSQVYLEALPHLLSILAVLAFVRSKPEQRDKWFWLSALALGAATAGKFTYIPVVVMVLAYLALFEKKIPLGWLVIYAALAVTTFFAFDVTLWHDPLGRILAALSFHSAYSQGAHVLEVGYPWYQPFIWVFTSAPAQWHPDVFFYFGFDGLISILAIAGIKREWQQRRWLVVWLAFGMLFLLLWPTKWPQYSLSITPALCLMASESIRRTVQWAREQESYWDYLSMMLPAPSKWLWAIASVFVTFIAVIYFSAAIKLAVGRIGWSHITTESSLLPSQTINDLSPGTNGEMLIATEKGAAIWYPPLAADQPDRWELFNTTNSALPNDNVLSLARTGSGTLWLGTQAGLARYDGAAWKIFHQNDLGLTNEQITALATDQKTQVYAGTPAGAAVWDGSAWSPIQALNGKQIFSLCAARGSLWAATLQGVYRIDLASGMATFYPTREAARHISIDSKGSIWAATADGIARLDNDAWTYFDTTNSGLPLNVVTTITEAAPGSYWIATSNSANAGGLLTSLYNENWHTFTADNSGFSTSEALVIASSQDGKIWIGTRNHGLDIFRPGR
jgi:hypothetical protein